MTGSDRNASEQMLSFRAERELAEALQRIAERNDRSLSAEIRRALKKHVTAEAKAA